VDLYVVAVVAVAVLNPYGCSLHISLPSFSSAIIPSTQIHYASGLSNVYHNHFNISSPNC